MTASSPSNPDAPCDYCAAFSVGTPLADELVCTCDAACGASRCSANEPPPKPATLARTGVAAGSVPAIHPTEQTSAASASARGTIYDPDVPVVTDPVRDFERRWHPNPRAVRHALALLDAEPAADMAVIPMFMPCKQRAVWESGQQVHTVTGVVLLSVNTDKPTGPIRSHSWARNTASRIATDALAAHIDARPDQHENCPYGTIAWAVVDRDGYVSRTEDMPEPDLT